MPIKSKDIAAGVRAANKAIEKFGKENPVKTGVATGVGTSVATDAAKKNKK